MYWLAGCESTPVISLPASACHRLQVSPVLRDSTIGQRQGDFCPQIGSPPLGCPHLWGLAGYIALCKRNSETTRRVRRGLVGRIRLEHPLGASARSIRSEHLLKRRKPPVATSSFWRLSITLEFDLLGSITIAYFARSYNP